MFVMETDVHINRPDDDDPVGLGTDISRGLRRRFKSTASARDIPMNKAVAEALEAWISPTTGKAYVTPKGGPNTVEIPNSQVLDLPVSSLMSLLGSIQAKIEAIEAQNAAILEKLPKTSGQRRPHRRSEEKTDFEAAALELIKELDRYPEGRKKAARNPKKLAAQARKNIKTAS